MAGSNSEGQRPNLDAPKELRWQIFDDTTSHHKIVVMSEYRDVTLNPQKITYPLEKRELQLAGVNHEIKEESKKTLNTTKNPWKIIVEEVNIFSSPTKGIKVEAHWMRNVYGAVMDSIIDVMDIVTRDSVFDAEQPTPQIIKNELQRSRDPAKSPFTQDLGAKINDLTGQRFLQTAQHLQYVKNQENVQDFILIKICTGSLQLTRGLLTHAEWRDGQWPRVMEKLRCKMPKIKPKVMIYRMSSPFGANASQCSVSNSFKEPGPAHNPGCVFYGGEVSPEKWDAEWTV